MFKKTVITFISLILVSSLSADESEATELFQEADCMSCHNTEDFKSDPKKTKNFHKLNSSVQACQQANDAGWFDDETLDVSKYLNKKYYHFKEPKEVEE